MQKRRREFKQLWRVANISSWVLVSGISIACFHFPVCSKQVFSMEVISSSHSKVSWKLNALQGRSFWWKASRNEQSFVLHWAPVFIVTPLVTIRVCDKYIEFLICEGWSKKEKKNLLRTVNVVVVLGFLELYGDVYLAARGWNLYSLRNRLLVYRSCQLSLWPALGLLSMTWFPPHEQAHPCWYIGKQRVVQLLLENNMESLNCWWGLSELVAVVLNAGCLCFPFRELQLPANHYIWFKDLSAVWKYVCVYIYIILVASGSLISPYNAIKRYRYCCCVVVSAECRVCNLRVASSIFSPFPYFYFSFLMNDGISMPEGNASCPWFASFIYGFSVWVKSKMFSWTRECFLGKLGEEEGWSRDGSIRREACSRLSQH